MQYDRSLSYFGAIGIILERQGLMIILAAYLIGALMFSPLLWRMSGRAAESNEQTGAVPMSSRSLRLWFLVLMVAVWPLMVLVMIVGAFNKAGKNGPESQ